MQKRKLLLVVITLVIIVASGFTALALTTSSPSKMEIAKGANLIWEKTFGGPGDDRAFDIANVGSGYVVVGSSTSFIPGKTVAVIVRFDSNGNELWNRTFIENFGSEFRYVYALQDGFLTVGNAFLASGDSYGVVAKFGLQGDLLWNVTLKASEGVNKLFSGMYNNGSLVVTGFTQPDGNYSNTQAWIVKLDNSGNIIWNRTYENSSNSAAMGITLTQDNCYMVAGYVDPSRTSNYDFLVLKLDTNGELLWNKTYGGPESDKAYAIASAPDGCIIAGNTYSYGAGNSDAWIIKIDLNGKLLWDKTFGGKEYDSPSCMSQAQGGGYLVAGTTFSFGNGNRDFWLFKVSDNGNIVWSCTVGRSGYEEAYGVVNAGNNYYAMAGWTDSIGAGGRYDFYIVKIQAPPS